MNVTAQSYYSHDELNIIHYRVQGVSETIDYETVQNYEWIESLNDFSMSAAERKKIKISIDTDKQYVTISYIGGITHECQILEFKEEVTVMEDGGNMFVNIYSVVSNNKKPFLLEVDTYTKNIAFYSKYRKNSGYNGFHEVEALVVQFK